MFFYLIDFKSIECGDPKITKSRRAIDGMARREALGLLDEACGGVVMADEKRAEREIVGVLAFCTRAGWRRQVKHVRSTPCSLTLRNSSCWLF
jgi:hypothetical protein